MIIRVKTKKQKSIFNLKHELPRIKHELSEICFLFAMIESFRLSKIFMFNSWTFFASKATQCR